MFGKFALPTDDRAGLATSIVASAEDPEYPAENLVATSTTGHLNLPSRPAELTTNDGYWDLGFASPIDIVGAAVIYHNFDEGLDVTLELGSGSPFATSVPIPIPAHHADGWPVSPWVEFAAVSADAVRLSINEANSLPPQVGRLLLLAAIRQLEDDVRWGVEETEEHGFIEHRTALGVDTIYDLGGKRRAVNGEITLIDSRCGDFQAIFQQARTRVQPWLLIPDAGENDAWLVRWEQGKSRVRETLNHNIFPFRVRELARGLPFP